MDLFTRLFNGWKIAKLSMKVLNAHKSLIMFPVLSGISLALIVISFFTVLSSSLSGGVMYLLIFLFYIVNYFIVVFFNMGLMHCVRLHFEGKEVSVDNGLKFSASRVGAVFSWALFAATVGMLLKIVQDNLGMFGRIATGVVGIVWSVATFFVIPVLAYEHVGPADAVKRSTAIVKEKWGEALGANFSLGLVFAVVFLVLGVIGIGISSLLNEQAGIIVFVSGAFMAFAVSNALHSIFVSALYNQINGNGNSYLDDQAMDDLFITQ